MIKKSFDAIVPANSKVLILGSLPGDRSLAEQQYYAHPQNRFWKLIFHLFEEDLPTDYPARLALLHRHGIALWDVCQTAFRKGSMDLDILQEVPNPIPQLLETQPGIQAIFFNGQKAEKLFDKYFQRSEGISYYTLPSSSPANASFNQDRLLERWKTIHAVLT
ncbi:DNA-deoxyinosine glycosylase [Sphingobacterium paludis]|uniref:G/U mismatch-specific uracil-DNA glycosylase n=1 Tax=Sphingobacterium paludis TaxID=1476465 RepID=A0A4V3E2Q1_9SPHI|nr:DNA-deoxyinosine glycosylase [Sphingobacterium paludis]TDS17288.1 G/U mismatch-specific uracil-DNA glycosylase [Sphingobacterium paludis]